jgi:hypothetical protein
MKTSQTQARDRLDREREKARREAELLYARQIQQQTGCSRDEAMRVAIKRIAKEQ